MTQFFVGITLDIIDYYPLDYDYSSFSFLFMSESKDFEREISYINANQICQKIPLSKKDIKYSITVTKDDSFIGISELVIPFQSINKKEKIFDKVCPITMTDSIKKLLFGSVENAIPLKIGIHATLQYLAGENSIDTSNKKEKLVLKQKKKKEEKMKLFSPKPIISKDKSLNVIANSNSCLNNKINSKILLNNSTNKVPKKGESFISNVKNNKTYKGHKRACSTQRQAPPQPKPMKNTFRGKQNEKEKMKTEINQDNEKSNNNIKNYTDIENNTEREEEIEINKKDNINDNNANNIYNQDYDEILNKKFNIENICELKKSMNNYIESNFNTKLKSINEINEMINYTNNNIKCLLNYQMKYYELIKNEIDLTNKNNELLLENNEKYRTNLARINKLKDDINYNKIKRDILLNNDKIYDKEITNLKNKEFNILNEISSIIKIQNKNSQLEKETDKQFNNKNEQFLLLFKVLKKINNKYGPLQNLLNQSNSTEPQRNNLRKIINKYNKELEINVDNKITSNINNNINNNSNNSQNIENFEFVLSTKPDDIDIKIELFLKQFYLKHNIPKIIFKKTSKNNYEYGAQKIIVKLEGEAIRVRNGAGYLLLDKFVELNAPLEDKKSKKTNINDNNKSKTNIKKKNKK